MTIRDADLALVDAARRGDPVALAALLRALRPHIRQVAERRCIANADDATQEALWTLYQRIPTLRSVAAFPAWLLRIVARICFGLVGPVWRRVEALKEADAAHAADGIGLDLRLDLANAVACLPETYRDAIWLHYYEDVAVADIAARLGISIPAAKVRLHRGRDLVRQRLADGSPSP